MASMTLPWALSLPSLTSRITPMKSGTDIDSAENTSLTIMPMYLAAVLRIDVLSRELSIPTIGIGAGPDCDAQVLVWQDMAGLRTGKAPRFVKRYADVGTVLEDAARAYAADVAAGTFPAAEHSFES